MTSTTSRTLRPISVVPSVYVEEDQHDGAKHFRHVSAESRRWPRFLVNRSGLPFDELTWNQMWSFAAFLQPSQKSQLLSIRTSPHLEAVAIPRAPKLSFAPLMGAEKHLEKVQMYLEQLGYNHTGTQFFEVGPKWAMRSLMTRAKEMIREALPIKCVEAVVIALHLTNGIQGLGRFTINFKSEIKHYSNSGCSRRYFYHVVLGISLGNKFGAVGLSRRRCLSSLRPVQQSLGELVSHFAHCYASIGHKLVKVRIGGLVTHDPCSIQALPWHGITLTFDDNQSCDVELLNAYAKHLKVVAKGPRRKRGFWKH